ncbi:MAG: lipoprotein LenA [Spirochaetia bacterium]|nr:lipoprotein LenA [Spirochaetia bacterium]
MRKRKFAGLGLVIFLTINIINCKDKKQEGAGEILEKKYATTRVAIFKDSSFNKDKYVATVEKAEEVGLLEEVKPKEGQKPTLAKIRLVDGKEGYLKLKYLAGTPIVFNEDTKVYDRPTIASRVRVTAPKGKLGFILEQKGGWSQVYIGKVKGKWYTKHWVESASYSTEKNSVYESREYESALELLSENKREEALTKLQDLTSGSSELISTLATQKLAEIEGGAVPDSSGEQSEPEEDQPEDSSEDAQSDSSEEPINTIEESR